MGELKLMSVDETASLSSASDIENGPGEGELSSEHQGMIEY